MFTKYLQRGVAAGGVAGGVYGAYLHLVLQPQMEYMEGGAHGHGHGDGHAAEAVGELTAAAVSTGGAMMWGVLLGVGFAAAYYLLEPAIPGGRYRHHVLAAAGFVTVSAAPWTLLPPAAPGVEHVLGTGTRLVLYGVMMVSGAVASTTAAHLYRRFVSSHGARTSYAVASTPLAALAAFAVLTPAPYTGGPEPELVTSFVWTVVFGQAALWFGVAVCFHRLEGYFQSPTATGYSAEPVTSTE